MEPQCDEDAPPTIWVTMHLPATSWHKHFDEDFDEEHHTEWEAWAKVMLRTLKVVTGGSIHLMIGYWLDALNVLPPDARLALVSGITRGYGVEISAAEDAPDTIDVSLVPRYEPLAGPKVTEQGLLLPRKKGGEGLILPGTHSIVGGG